MKLTIVNPLREAIKQTRGINYISERDGQRNWKTTAFCWDCSKHKSKKDGRLFGTGPVRFKCAECIANSKSNKSAI